MRLRVGEELLLGDGRGGLASAVVRAVGQARLDVAVSKRWSAEPPAPRLVVAQGIAKGDRGELAVQAMTEVGVDEIVPWAAARSVARWKDGRPLERWRSVAREAAKQARRPWLPAVSPLCATAGRAPRAQFGLPKAAVSRVSQGPLSGLPETLLG